MRKRDVIDTSDGTVYFTGVDLARKPQRMPFGKKWCKMSLTGFDKLAKLDLKLTDIRVLFVVMSSLEDQHRVYVNQSSIAKHIGSHQASVSLSMRRLVELDVLRKTPGTEGRFTIYYLSPRYAWKGGDNAAHFQAIKDWDRVQ